MGTGKLYQTPCQRWVVSIFLQKREPTDHVLLSFLTLSSTCNCKGSSCQKYSLRAFGFKPYGGRHVWSSFNEGSDKGEDERALKRLSWWFEPALGLLFLVTLATDSLSHMPCMPKSLCHMRFFSRDLHGPSWVSSCQSGNVQHRHCGAKENTAWGASHSTSYFQICSQLFMSKCWLHGFHFMDTH